MRNNFFKAFILFLITFITFNFLTAQANENNLQPAIQVITDFNKILNEAKQTSHLPVIFPQKVPNPKQQKLFLTYSSYFHKPRYDKFIMLTATLTVDCNYKLCQVGGIIIRRSNHPIDKFYQQAPLNKPSNIPKEIVTLANKSVAYYTPGHAEASFVPATLEWQVDKVRYTLYWNNLANNAKEALVTMANSAQ